MEFKFETMYNQKAFTAMAKALRKTIRKKRSKRSHILGWIVAVLGIMLSFLNDGFVFKDMVTYIAVAAIIFALIFEDKLNGYIAAKRNMKRLDKSITVFNDDGYFSETELGSTQWKYENINTLAEDDSYFVFIFDISHAQLYDKSSISGGSAAEFRTFMEEKTGLKTERI